jgi:hypothetical protein
MTPRDFAYWLQGFFEVSNAKDLSQDQVATIKNHLNLVFLHDIDKQYKEGDNSQAVHDGFKEQNPHLFQKPTNGITVRC